MSVRCWEPARRTRLTRSYAAVRASARVGPVAVQHSTRPPELTRVPSTRRVPAWMTPGASAPLIGSPVRGVPGYPAAATTTVTADPARQTSGGCSASRPVAAAYSSPASGVFSNASTAWVSGSPKRQLNSITFGPSAVRTRPTYSSPAKGVPSRRSSPSVGRTTAASTSSTRFGGAQDIGDPSHQRHLRPHHDEVNGKLHRQRRHRVKIRKIHGTQRRDSPDPRIPRRREERRHRRIRRQRKRERMLPPPRPKHQHPHELRTLCLRHFPHDGCGPRQVSRGGGRWTNLAWRDLADTPA